jgi:hypothetical protein
LLGTSLFQADKDAPVPFSLGKGNFRFVLRLPLEQGQPLQREHLIRLHTEMARLRLESFDGKQVVPSAESFTIDDRYGMLIFGAELVPGTYVVVQNVDSSKQVCMTVPLWDSYTTIAFALALHDGSEPVPLQLAHVSIAALRTDQMHLDHKETLLRLEAVRKAIGAGRPAFGWTGLRDSETEAGSIENPLLRLLDCQQKFRWLLSGNNSATRGTPPPDELSTLSPATALQIGDEIGQLQKASGHTSVDAISLRLAHKQLSEHAAEISAPDVLTGPPLMKRSWDQLLASKAGDTLAGRLMPFGYEVLPSSTWFLWMEAPDVRANSMSKAAQREVGGLVVDSDAPTLAASYSGILSMGLAAVRQFGGRIPMLRRLGVSSALEKVSIEDVEAMLAALLKSETFGEWLNKAQLAYEAEGKTIQDESMRKLIASLRAFSDVVLVQALGAEVVAKQVLGTLKLPQSRVVSLVKDLLKGLVTRLAGPDRKNMLLILHSALDLAEARLLMPPKQP